MGTESQAIDQDDANRVLLPFTAFLGTWQDQFFSQVPEPPPLLHHYTDVNGMANILKSNELWATNAIFMNDHTEIIHTAGIFNAILAAQEEGELTEHELAYRVWSDGAIRYVLSKVHTFCEAYVVCFCADPDLLSQWRGYGGGGGGYSLGFKADVLTSLGSGGLTLVRVIYDEDEQRRRVGELVSAWRALYVNHFPLDEPRYVPVMHAVFARIFSVLATSFKNPAFAEEQEWRLCYQRPRLPDPLPVENFRVESRTRNGMPVPFVRFKSPIVPDPPPLPVETICVGPQPNVLLALSGVWHLIQEIGIDQAVTIAPSAVPLRA